MTRALLFTLICSCAAAPAPLVAKPPVCPTSPSYLLVSDATTWRKTGRDLALYRWELDREAGAMVLERNDKEPDKKNAWAASVMEIPAAGFIGKRLRFTANVRTEDATGGASVWLRVDDKRGPSTLCNLTSPTTDARLKGTHPYTPLTCTLDVPESTKHLLFGTILGGPGHAWVKQGTLEEVSRDVPESPHYAPEDTNELPLGDAKLLGIDEAALDRLVSDAGAAGSDALVVLKDGHIIADTTFDHGQAAIETMSVTKAIVGLAIGKLVDQKKIASIDTPLTKWFPQWSKDAHAKITLRMILNHTSCLRSAPTTEEIYASQDWVKLALDAELVCDPGTKSSYNNKAVNLLAPIVEAASGKRLDDYVREEIFGPLGIKTFEWASDPAGHPQCMAGLKMRAFDLAKVGQMLVDRGTWKGARVISEDWIKQATEDAQPHSTFGLLWWRISDPSTTRLSYDDAHIDALKQAHVPKPILDKLETIRGKLFTRAEFLPELDKLLTPDERQQIRKANDTVIAKLGSDVAFVPGPPLGFQANGFLGQWLVVVPRDHLVAVRMIRAPGKPDGGMKDFDTLVTKLVTR
jgi:CubicO group peptidase (beta-lactamase class C family)